MPPGFGMLVSYARITSVCVTEPPSSCENAKPSSSRKNTMKSNTIFTSLKTLKKKKVRKFIVLKLSTCDIYHLIRFDRLGRTFTYNVLYTRNVSQTESNEGTYYD